MIHSRRLLLTLVLLSLLSPKASSGLRAAVGLEYDDNPFETRSGKQRSGWINRFFLSSSAHLKQSPRYLVRVRHQWGIKRYWKSERANGSRGDVVASHLELGGMAQLSERVSATWASEVKIKNVQRISSEESYLRGNLRLGVKGRLDNGFSGALRFRRGGDDARDTTLADLSVSEWGGEVAFSVGRMFTGRLAAAWRRLNYDRSVLRASEGEDGKAGDQADRSRELKAAVQLYRGGLVNASYALLDNDSNSTGLWLQGPSPAGSLHQTSSSGNRRPGIRDSSEAPLR